MVKAHELSKIRAGCSKTGQRYGQPNYHPPITLVICDKRHHTRFF